MRAICAVLFLLFFGSSIYAQSTQIFDTSNSTIPENGLWGITIDHKGNKWIGTTKHGVVKYNDKNFSICSKDSTPIKGDLISELFVDHTGDLWIIDSKPTQRILKFDGKKWTIFTSDTYPEININKGIAKITQDAKGKIYFGTNDGIITFDGSKWSKLELPGQSIYKYNVLAIDISKEGKIAVGTDENLLLFNGKEWQKLSVENSELQLGTVRAVKYLDNGQLYIGYGGGFGKGGFSILKDGIWQHYNKNNSSIPDQMVRDIKVTDDGAIWMATNDGLLKVNGKKMTPIKFRPGRYQNTIMGIAIENGKTVWVATTTGLVKLN